MPPSSTTNLQLSLLNYLHIKKFNILWGHKAQQSAPTSCTGPEAQAEAHNRIWRRQGRSWQPKNLTENNFVLG